MVSRPSVVTVSSFGRQKLIKDMTRISVYAFKQVIVGFLKEFCYSWGFRATGLVASRLLLTRSNFNQSNVTSSAAVNIKFFTLLKSILFIKYIHCKIQV